ncbi:MAG: ABC transporter ATP-binding protein, partial [Myxococcales bacterium]|nr:ABC transporter ATP-binding protein [Myxococcales bacterium]
AGKTTTMRLVLGLLRPSRGHARFQGTDCTENAIEVKRHIGYSPDEPTFYDFLTGKETVEFVLGVRGLSIDAAWPQVEALAHELAFAEFLPVLTGGYSHGTKKKLALLLALLHEPKLLLLDEPTNGLDPPTALRVRDMLRARAQAGAAVVVSTHHLDLADRMCERVLVLHQGQCIADGPVAEVRAQAGVGDGASLEEVFFALLQRPAASSEEVV